MRPAKSCVHRTQGAVFRQVNSLVWRNAMRQTTIRSLATAALVSLALAGPAAAAECTLVGGIGTGLTEGIAKFMSDAALKNIIEGKGLKPTGEITHTCTAGTFATECTARQQGCK